MTLFKEFNEQVQYGTSFGLPSHICLLYFEVTQVKLVKIGVANGKCETLRDGETSVFLCEPETF